MSFPQTEVAFAPTKAFVAAFPEEAKEQGTKFTTPSWAPKVPVETVTGGIAAVVPLEIKKDAEEIRDFIIGAVVGAGAVFLVYYVTRYYLLPLIPYGQVE